MVEHVLLDFLLARSVLRLETVELRAVELVWPSDNGGCYEGAWERARCKTVDNNDDNNNNDEDNNGDDDDDNNYAWLFDDDT